MAPRGRGDGGGGGGGGGFRVGWVWTCTCGRAVKFCRNNSFFSYHINNLSCYRNNSVEII